jgi:hypothetical protein
MCHIAGDHQDRPYISMINIDHIERNAPSRPYDRIAHIVGKGGVFPPAICYNDAHA